jgi:hypothetical protein
VGSRLHVVRSIVCERGSLFSVSGVVSSMGHCGSWVGGVIVHERGVVVVCERGGGGGSSSVSGRLPLSMRSCCCLTGAGVVVDHGGLESLFVGGCRPSTGWGSSSSHGGGRRPQVGGEVPTVRACSSSVGSCRS